MVIRLYQALIADTLRFLDSHRTFFDGQETERSALLEASTLPRPVQKVLLGSTAAQFMEEMALVQRYVSDGDASGRLAVALALILSKDLGDVLDKVSEVSYQGAFGAEMQQIAAHFTYQEVAEEVQQFLEACTNVPYIVVQSPFALSAPMRSEMRAHFQKEHKLCFPVFTVNKQLIGGIRVFIDGETQDLSWISRINALSNVLYSRV